MAFEDYSELDERKTIILKTIIKNYLDTGEPVGSRTISKYSGLNLSSATIRNEMSDLVEMGYIVQPHTSAGRVPSDKAYRFYVDSIIADSDRRVSAMTNMMFERMDRLESMLQAMVRGLASNTNYAALISGPSISNNRIKYLQLSVPSERRVLLILVLDGNVIKNEVLSVEMDVTQELVMNISIMLNNYLSGLYLKDIGPRMISDIMVSAGDYAPVVKIVLDSVIEMLESDVTDRDIFTSGVKNIVKYPELSDSDMVTELIQAFEEKDQLKELVNEVSALNLTTASEYPVRVYIGGEGPIKNLTDCSLVTANYELADGMTGVIGVIGPKRMDYEKVMKTMRSLMDQMNRAFNN